MNVVRQSEGITSVPPVVPGHRNTGTIRGALLGTWVSVIAVVMRLDPFRHESGFTLMTLHSGEEKFYGSKTLCRQFAV